MLRTERGILTTEKERDGGRETNERTTLARIIFWKGSEGGRGSRARYGVLMFRLCGIVRTSSPTTRVHNFHARRDGKAQLSTLDAGDLGAGIFMTYP